jgi:hypothetical protein
MEVEWSTSHLSRFTPGERASGNLWIGSWVDPKFGLDAVEKRKISCPCRHSTSALYPEDRRYTDRAIIVRKRVYQTMSLPVEFSAGVILLSIAIWRVELVSNAVQLCTFLI